jgi:AraC family transcriptional regulator of adaptative response / DNA-3-methyladenine glycosylase II
VELDDDARYRAVRSRDERFDGAFVLAVTSTGIYCRPSCPATTPKRANVRFYPSGAAALDAGFRACRRCRPDLTGAPWGRGARSALAAEALGHIEAGAVDEEGVAGLARRLAIGPRQLQRVLVAELGAGPLALARARRAQVARALIETTDLPFAQIAFASGCASIRQFNDLVRSSFGATPTVLRADRSAERRPGGGTLTLPLAATSPFAAAGVVSFLRLRAVAGVEVAPGDGTFVRALNLPRGHALVSLRATDDHLVVRCDLADRRDLPDAVAACRRLGDLDADIDAVLDVLRADPALATVVDAEPGRRSPGTAEGHEALVRAVVGQQISVAGARTVTGRIVAQLGEPLSPALVSGSHAAADPLAWPTHVFPTAEAIAETDPAGLSMPQARGRALVDACGLVADRRVVLDRGAPRVPAEQALLGVKGIGPWTTAYVAMRALGDPDAFLPTDLGVRRGLEALGLPGDPVAAASHAERWRPWRAYALHHLWAAAPPAG